MDTSYWDFVRYYRSMFNIPVFAITGTCGKTTTKEMITHILQNKHNVQSTRKSNNSHYLNLSYLCGITEETYPIDLLLAFGEFSKEIVLGAKGQNMEGKIILCKSARDIEKQLIPILNEETAVLVKTSIHDKSIVSLVSKLNKGIFLS